MPSAKIQRRVAQNALALLGGRAGGLVLSATSSVLLFRYLGNEVAGHYAALYAYLALFSWLASFGMDAVLAREVSRRRESASSILMTAVITGSTFAIVAASLALVVAPLLGYGQSFGLLVLASFEILVFTPLRLPAIILQAELRQSIGVVITASRQVLWLVSVILLIAFKAHLLLFVVVRLICAALEISAMLFVSFRFLERQWRFLWTEARALVKQSAPLAFSALSVGVYHRVDQVLLHNIAGDGELGHYVAAVNLVEILNAIPVAFTASLFPILSRITSEEAQFRRYVGQGFRYLMVAICGLALAISLGSDSFVTATYGTGYTGSSNILSTLVWSELALSWGVIAANAYIALGLQRHLLVPTAIGAVGNLALNALLIPTFGGIGAAWSTVISYTVGPVFAFTIPSATRPLAFLGLRMSASPVVLALTILGVFTLLPGPGYLKACLAMLAYFIGLHLTRTIGPADLTQIWRAVRPYYLERG